MISHHAVLLSAKHPLVFETSLHNIVSHFEYRLPQIGIDDVRTITQAAYRRPQAEAEYQTLLVATEFITEEAQQALLKLIEEPPISTNFIFVIPQGYGLLATLESRFERQVLENEKETTDISVFRAFKDSDYKERLNQIEHSTKNKDHAWQAEIKRGLLTYAYGHRAEIEIDKLKEYEYILRHLLTRGASNKFLLEHLALLLP